MKKRIPEALEECSVSYEYVVQFIEEEWIIPDEEALLDEEDIARIRLIRELRDDFGVNDEGIPIILHLIDEINLLRLSRKVPPSLSAVLTDHTSSR